MQFAFNSGTAFMVNQNAANPTPDQIGILQSSSLDIKFTNKKLYGQNIYPVAAGRSQGDVTGKVQFAQYRSRLLTDFSGGSQTTGQTLIANNEAGTVAASSPYQYQTTNHSTFVEDLGVLYTATGLPLQCVASSPAQGQYTISSGTYTFAAADEGAAIQVSYTYTQTGSGETVTISNASAGAANLNQMVLGMSYNGLQGNIILPACLMTSLKLADNKIGDFGKPEMEFDAICNSAGTLMTVSLAEVS